MRSSFVNGTSIATVAEGLGLPWDPSMQDWAIEVADAHRIEEFSRALSEACDAGERTCLLDLVLASLDEWLAAGVPVPQSEVAAVARRIRDELGPALHELPDVAEYWGEHFPQVADFMRTVLSLPR